MRGDRLRPGVLAVAAALLLAGATGLLGVRAAEEEGAQEPATAGRAAPAGRTGMSPSPGAPAPASPVPPASPPSPAAPSPAGPAGVYAHTLAGMLDPAVAGMPTRVYVPNEHSDTVTVIDPTTRGVVGTFPAGSHPHHVVPSWDLRTLWVASTVGNSLTAVDPHTASPTGRVAVDDPYNLYFTPDGSTAIVVAERLRRLDFRDAQTMELQQSLGVDCAGVNHLDIAADGRTAVASCEFDGQLLKLDLDRREVVARTRLPAPATPQDVRVDPDGTTFYVTDLDAGGVHVVDGDSLEVLDFLPTGAGAHGLQPSRDATRLFVSNRNAGSVSVIEFASRSVVATWPLPGGASPDMGGLTADGSELWLTGRYHGEVYAISTADGSLLARIPVGTRPHGLALFPQPGRYSLGHTGVYR